MSEIVEQIRDLFLPGDDPDARQEDELAHAAADEIERLRKQYINDIRKLEDKLESIECGDCGKDLLQCECEVPSDLGIVGKR